MGIINPENGLGTVIHQNQINPGRDFFIGLLPGYGFEAVVHSLERGANSVRIIKIVNITMPLGAHDSSVPVRFGIALDLPDAIAPNISENGAAVAASIAEGGNPGDGGLGLGFGPGFEIQDPRAQGKGPGAQGGGFEKSSPGDFRFDIFHPRLHFRVFPSNQQKQRKKEE